MRIGSQAVEQLTYSDECKFTNEHWEQFLKNNKKKLDTPESIQRLRVALSVYEYIEFSDTKFTNEQLLLLSKVIIFISKATMNNNYELTEVIQEWLAEIEAVLEKNKLNKQRFEQECQVTLRQYRNKEDLDSSQIAEYYRKLSEIINSPILTTKEKEEYEEEQSSFTERYIAILLREGILTNPLVLPIPLLSMQDILYPALIFSYSTTDGQKWSYEACLPKEYGESSQEDIGYQDEYIAVSNYKRRRLEGGQETHKLSEVGAKEEKGAESLPSVNSESGSLTYNEKEANITSPVSTRTSFIGTYAHRNSNSIIRGK